jgi:hypothetical protein
MLTVVFCGTPRVEMSNVPVVCPAAITILAGTVATAELDARVTS